MSETRLGPNHRYGCDGKDWRFSGSGYNRVRLCACGAEDHAPEPGNAFGKWLQAKFWQGRDAD